MFNVFSRLLVVANSKVRDIHMKGGSIIKAARPGCLLGWVLSYLGLNKSFKVAIYIFLGGNMLEKTVANCFYSVKSVKVRACLSLSFLAFLKSFLLLVDVIMTLLASFFFSRQNETSWGSQQPLLCRRGGFDAPKICENLERMGASAFLIKGRRWVWAAKKHKNWGLQNAFYKAIFIALKPSKSTFSEDRWNPMAPQKLSEHRGIYYFGGFLESVQSDSMFFRWNDSTGFGHRRHLLEPCEIYDPMEPWTWWLKTTGRRYVQTGG